MQNEDSSETTGDAAPSRRLPSLEDPLTRFYWTAGASGQLRIQRCGDCRRWQHPPLPNCPCCHGERMVDEPVSGTGRIATFTVNRQAWRPGLTEPYVYAAIELAEQAELYVFANILAPVEAVFIGQQVEVRFEHFEDIWLPMFVPAGNAG